MRLVIRLISSLVICLLLVSVFSSYYQIRREKRSLRGELERRAEVLAESLEQNVERELHEGLSTALSRTVQRFGNNNHLLGIAVYDQTASRALAISPTLAARIPERPSLLEQAMAEQHSIGQFARMDGGSVHLFADPLHAPDGNVIGGLLVVHDASYITASTWRAWHEVSVRLIVQVCLVAVITFFVFQRSVVMPIARTTQWMRELRHGRTAAVVPPSAEMFGALAHEATFFAKSLADARASAQHEARLRDSAESFWTAERLAVSLQTKLQGSRLFVVANREPYMHVREGRTVKAIMPASGLVTGLEPILRACDGTWVAHGSGNADRETVDMHDHLRVPPEDPRYSLRRVWLTQEQERGYYLGFSNEGLWPLCHIAHTRPTFRAADWEQYKRVNALFAEAVIEEMADTEQPVVIVQDYHFALLPKLIKERRPDARVGIFWHIPWPNSEAFGICPWQSELLEGMIGADLIGFHVQGHCDNFLDTVNTALEARVDWERFAVCQRGHTTLVRPFPISVVFPESDSSPIDNFHAHQAALLNEIGAEALYVGVGVDRVDYTKGILERFLGVERFLEKYPQYQGKFSFIQIGAPSRTNVKRYHDFFNEVSQECERINRRFASGNWRPILFRNWHHDHAEVARFYKAADLCLVTSLHDGMNLVAKEFLASRSDEDGALILSPFTGAARELTEALIVSPYDTESVADAIFRALEMNPAERKSRMRLLRAVVKEQNVYRWAGTLIGQLCEVRTSSSQLIRRKELVRSAAMAGQITLRKQLIYDFDNSSAMSTAGNHLSS